jgi:hypothetical protein
MNFVPQDLWQMPMTLEWHWNDVIGGPSALRDPTVASEDDDFGGGISVRSSLQKAPLHDYNQFKQRTGVPNGPIPDLFTLGLEPTLNALSQNYDSDSPNFLVPNTEEEVFLPPRVNLEELRQLAEPVVRFFPGWHQQQAEIKLHQDQITVENRDGELRQSQDSEPSQQNRQQIVPDVDHDEGLDGGNFNGWSVDNESSLIGGQSQNHELSLPDRSLPSNVEFGTKSLDMQETREIYRQQRMQQIHAATQRNKTQGQQHQSSNLGALDANIQDQDPLADDIDRGDMTSYESFDPLGWFISDWLDTYGGPVIPGSPGTGGDPLGIGDHAE